MVTFLDGPRFREPGPEIRLLLDSGMQTTRVRVIQNHTTGLARQAENVFLSVSVKFVVL
jgi:hypothetical protein